LTPTIGHSRYKGTCGRGIYDNMKTAVETVFVGKDRLYNWVLPAAMERVRRKLASADHGNRQMVDILTAVLTDGLPALAPRRSRRASIPPTSSSTSWLASATPGRPQRSSRQPG
jgi:hypothetical protein